MRSIKSCKNTARPVENYIFLEIRFIKNKQIYTVIIYYLCKTGKIHCPSTFIFQSAKIFPLNRISEWVTD